MDITSLLELILTELRLVNKNLDDLDYRIRNLQQELTVDPSDDSHICGLIEDTNQKIERLSLKISKD